MVEAGKCLIADWDPWLCDLFATDRVQDQLHSRRNAKLIENMEEIILNSIAPARIILPCRAK